jgi:peptidoglycan/LPS O-acetylase OafA/YrhL
VARIWPVHLFTCLMAFCLLPFVSLYGHVWWKLALPANLLLVHAWIPFQGTALSFNGVSWSLSVEVFFYLCFPWLLRSLKQRGSLPLLAGTFGLGFMIVVTAAIFWPSHAIYFAVFNPICRLFEFVLGMATCRLWLDKKRSAKNPSTWFGYELLMVVFSLLAVVAAPRWGTGWASAMPIATWLGTDLCALAFASLIWIFAFQAGPISRVLSLRFLTRFGEISFAVYMCHQILLRWFALSPIGTASEAWRIFALYLLITLAVSAAIFYLIETPARHVIVSAYKRWSPRKRNVRPAT